MDELTAEFVAETRETLERAGEALVAWEAEPADAARLDEIFRFVHTVKGSCGFLDLPRIAALAHEAETVLGECRVGSRAPDAALVGAMLSVIDRIALLVEAIESGAAVPDEGSDAPLIAALTAPVVIAPEADAPSVQAARNVRLPVELLDAMMSQVSDLVLARNALARAMREGDAEGAFERLSATIGDLRDSVSRTRMLPIERLFAALPRLVRDTAAQVGKNVELSIDGADVEIDREMIEAIRDPLTHIVRNAIDHGIESASARAAAGKPATGSLRVSARQAGNKVAITIADDGAGIDVERLLARAVKAKAVSTATAAAMGPTEAARLIFAAGLSTAETVTELSGRGVGMDVVRANVERLGGTVTLDNRPGDGLAITLRVPLTLSILSALLVEAGGQRFAVPRAAIHEIVATNAESVRFEAVGQGWIAVVRGALLPVIALDRALALSESEATRLVVIDAPGCARFALAVAATLDHEELVVRPTAPLLGASGVFAGQSLPDDGAPVLLLDPLGLAGMAEIARGEQEAQTEIIAVAPSRSALTVTTLAGERRAIRAALVERIEDVPVGDFATVGRQHFVKLDGVLRPLRADGPLPRQGLVAVLRLTGPDGPVGHAVAAVHDLVPLGAVTPVERGEGLILVEGRPLPLIGGVAPPKRSKAA